MILEIQSNFEIDKRVIHVSNVYKVIDNQKLFDVVSNLFSEKKYSNHSHINSHTQVIR